MTMHVIHDGPPEAAPLLLIHGSGASSGFWKPVVPALAAHRHVIRIDLPGCGQSPPASRYDPPTLAAEIATLLDGLGLPQVTVAGHSSGGWVATALAERRPDLVRSLALVSTGPAMDALRPEPVLLTMLLAPPLGPLLWPIRTDTMIRKGIQATLARPVHLPDDVIAELRTITYRTVRSVLRANTAYLAEKSVPDRLTGLGIGVLAVFGAADPRWDPASAHRYTTVPGTRVVMLPGVGHVPMFEDPQRTADLLLTAE